MTNRVGDRSPVTYRKTNVKVRRKNGRDAVAAGKRGKKSKKRKTLDPLRRGNMPGDGKRPALVLRLRRLEPRLQKGKTWKDFAPPSKERSPTKKGRGKGGGWVRARGFPKKKKGGQGARPKEKKKKKKKPLVSLARKEKKMKRRTDPPIDRGKKGGREEKFQSSTIQKGLRRQRKKLECGNQGLGGGGRGGEPPLRSSGQIFPRGKTAGGRNQKDSERA